MISFQPLPKFLLAQQYTPVSKRNAVPYIENVRVITNCYFIFFGSLSNICIDECISAYSMWMLSSFF